MKKFSFLIIFFVLPSFMPVNGDNLGLSSLVQSSFTTGESLTYKVHYGWMEVGLATMKIDKQLYEKQGKVCYKIDIAGESKGLPYLFFKTKNAFGSYLDTTTLASQGFYRFIQEGKYRKNERISFDYNKKLAVVERLDDYTYQLLDTVSFPICEAIQDIVSNWYVLRNQDFEQLHVGDALSNVVFFDDTLHQAFSTKFLGRKTITTKLGSFHALVLAPLVPSATHGLSIFAGENSVELFLSDDQNKIPLKIKIKLLVGAIEIDLIKCQGLKYALKQASQ